MSANSLTIISPVYARGKDFNIDGFDFISLAGPSVRRVCLCVSDSLMSVV